MTKKMVPVLAMRSEAGRFWPMPNSKRRPHSLAWERDHVVALGPRSNLVRETCFPAIGAEAPRAVIWCAYLDMLQADWTRCWIAWP